MTKTVNLGKFRKIKAKEQKEKLAAENRVAFGRAKHEKTLDDKVRNLGRKEIDGKKFEKIPDDK